MAQTPAKATEKNRVRPILIAALAGSSAFLSAFYFLSPGPSSTDLSSLGQMAPLSRGTVEKPVEKKPVASRYDFRLTENDTFYSVMSVLKVPGPEIQGIVTKARPYYDLRQLKKDTVLKIFTLDGMVTKVEYGFNDFEVLTVERDGNADGGFSAKKTELAHETRQNVVSGSIENSLYEDGVKAGADPQAIMALSDIFAWDVDFASDIHRGDSFSILYETLVVEGRPVRTGRVLGAGMVNNGKTFTAVYFQDNRGHGGYYSPEGKSLARTLLKSPLRYRRVTSYFTNRRFHPILKQYRPHHGIDYAAAKGTPVESSGNGRVTFAGWRNGYGNFIEVKHTNGYLTAYGHLSRIAKGIRAGARVDQGDVIGYVGSTGISTGPHLHYEVRSGGRLINPLGIKSEPERSIESGDKARFAALSSEVSARLSGQLTNVAALSYEEHPVNQSPRR